MALPLAEHEPGAVSRSSKAIKSKKIPVAGSALRPLDTAGLLPVPSHRLSNRIAGLSAGKSSGPGHIHPLLAWQRVHGAGRHSDIALSGRQRKPSGNPPASAAREGW